MTNKALFSFIFASFFLTSCGNQDNQEEIFLENYKTNCKASTTPYGYSENTASAYCDCTFQLILRSGMTIPEMMKADRDILKGVKSDEYQKFMDLSLEAQLSCGNIVLKGKKITNP